MYIFMENVQHDLKPPLSTAEEGQKAKPHTLRLTQLTGRQGALLAPWISCGCID